MFLPPRGLDRQIAQSRFPDETHQLLGRSSSVSLSVTPRVPQSLMVLFHPRSQMTIDTLVACGVPGLAQRRNVFSLFAVILRGLRNREVDA